MNKFNMPPILYAEDNSLDVELTMDAFEEIHLSNRVDRVKDGQEVLDYLRYEGEFADRKKERPCLILLDNKMPRMTGIEALKYIKNDTKFRDIPIIMMASSKLERELFQSHNYEVNAYIIKPVDFGQFIYAIKNIGIFWGLWNKTADI